jgi:hypothetical protein
MSVKPDEWGPEQWEGRARMAEARRHAGLELDQIDTEALRRYPAPPTSCAPIPTRRTNT